MFKKSVDPALSIEARFQMLEMALKIELLPRVMWVMALPFGGASLSNIGIYKPITDHNYVNVGFYICLVNNQCWWSSKSQ